MSLSLIRQMKIIFIDIIRYNKDYDDEFQEENKYIGICKYI